MPPSTYLRAKPLIWLFALLAILVGVFGQTLVSLFTYAMNEKLHSHIVLIPLVSAYLIYINRDSLPNTFRRSWGGMALWLALGILSIAAYFLYGRDFSLNDSLALRTFSFLCLGIAIGFACLGRPWMAAIAFPIGFLVFMIPLPDIAVERLEVFLQWGSTEMTAVLFNLAGLPYYREGTVFQLPGIVLEVARECSGIRSTWVLFITSLLASYMFLKSPWRRAVLVAFVLPLAILRNGVRILTIGLLCVHIGPHMIDSIVHKRGGPFFFALSLIPLFALMWWLCRGERKPKEGPSAENLDGAPILAEKVKD